MLKNPNSKRAASSSNQWSQLPQDLTRSIFKRLSFSDFERGKLVCSSWYSASRQQCYPKNQIPWLILFPRDKNCCKLLNPEDKDNKMYTTQDLGVDFAESKCVATYGCWLLMMNTLRNFFILDLLTGERIDLPPIESQIGNVKLERMVSGEFRFTDDSRSRVSPWVISSPHQLWIDEKTKDYLVMWSFENKYVVICKKGDKSWKQITDYSGIAARCSDMVYKNQKLYVYENSLFVNTRIRILDFSGELRVKVLETQVDLVKIGRGIVGYKQRMVVTVSGDVLMVTCVKNGDEDWLPEIIYGINETTKKWEKVLSLGDVAMILDLGITVVAKDVEGIKKNSIYFSCVGPCLGKDNNMEFFVFDLETKKIQRPYNSVCSSLQYPRGQWFFPNFIRKQSD